VETQVSDHFLIINNKYLFTGHTIRSLSNQSVIRLLFAVFWFHSNSITRNTVRALCDKGLSDDMPSEKNTIRSQKRFFS
jgi:hypothetical protein